LEDVNEDIHHVYVARRLI